VSAPAATAPSVRFDDLKIGAVLAEGGEGRVHQLPRLPHLVYKEYRRPADRSHLDELIAWPGSAAGPGGAETVMTAAAWPTATVIGAAGDALGLLMPRAPRRFAVRHRDGHSRLASLSYLTADPEHRAAAYGLALPSPVSAERVGLVLALARLLAAFESGRPAIGHGDLSTKNVLWSLQRGPEVFVLDCDNSGRFDLDGRSLEGPGRRRAMTPNWQDPAVAGGDNPTFTTDRYSLALIFLRVVGAANYPIQAGQRAGGPVEVRFAVPAGPAAPVLLDPEATVWRLCRRGLSAAAPAERPPADAWLGPLSDLVEELEGRGLTLSPSSAAAPEPGEVTITPEPATPRPRTWVRARPGPRYGAAPDAPPAIGYRSGRPGSTPAPRDPGTEADAPPTLWSELGELLRRFTRWWIRLHTDLVRSGSGPARMQAVGKCVVVDFCIAVLAAAAAAVVISPMIGS
jgi:hypothetical protein